MHRYLKQIDSKPCYNLKCTGFTSIQLAIAAGSLVFLIFFSNIIFNVYALFYRPLLANNANATIIQVDKASSASLFVHHLKQKQLIHAERLFLYLIRLEGLAQHLKAGIYQIKPGESAQQLLYRVVAGDNLVETFRIIEGTTVSQIAEHLAHANYLNYQAADWQKIAEQYNNAEGLLLADSYYYDAGSSSEALLNRAHANLIQYLQTAWQNRSPGLPYKNAYQLLIAASIIEKETAVPAERRLIAGVLVNRLRSMMPLQMDPTVIYALGNRYTGKLLHADLQVDSPYNSYRYRGLPPTPIAMVGKDAIDAAAHPQMTNYLYFVAKGDGSHQFSVNYVQQQQAIERYLKANVNHE